MNDIVESFTQSRDYWRESLKHKIRSDWGAEIDAFETEIHLKKQGKIEDKIFAETRLRRGAYGQRYDNGHRHDGTESRPIPLPEEELTKGPETYWHAPGMLRIKHPFGGLNTEQMLVLADLAEEYSDCILHVTTRQDIQLHYIHIEDTPTMFRRLAAVGITTREACGNSVRNVTACPMTGVCSTESFDVTPHAQKIFEYLLGHPDVQDFGRKFKIALSGCSGSGCGLAKMHDLGLVAVNKNGAKGFELWVGGGLGAVPYQAKLFSEFVSMEELFSTVQAICRVYARLGEKKKRHMARIKFLVAKLGIEEFRRLVEEEKAKLPEDARWQEVVGSIDFPEEKPLDSAAGSSDYPQVKDDAEYESWLASNVKDQAQPGFAMVSIRLPLGDMTSHQMRGLVEVSRKYIRDTVRLTVEQNVLLRWIPKSAVYDLYQDLKALRLSFSGAETLVDITACPGTDTCKLGIAASRGLAGVLSEDLFQRKIHEHPDLKDLKIKVSGCFNSCGQHHLADIGFYGTNRVINGFAVPHFQLTLGGEFTNNAGAYGIAIGNYPSKAIPKIVDALTEYYLAEKQDGEIFRNFIQRVGKKEVVARLKDFTNVPPHEADKSYYTDWGDIREFTMKDKGVGECAGEVVSLTDFGLKKADREVFESQLLLDEDKPQEAGELSYQAMKDAAQALVKHINVDISDNDEEVLESFTRSFYDTKLIFDPFGGDRFVQYYFHAHKNRGETFNGESAQHRVEEARLFVESAHSCNLKIAREGKDLLQATP